MADGTEIIKLDTHPGVLRLRESRSKRQDRDRQDSWFNHRSRFGGTTDPVMISTYIRSRGRTQRAEAETMYEFDWLTRRVIEQPAKDATREWIRLSHSTHPAKAEKLRVEDERLGGRARFKEGIRLARMHGGSVMVLGIWDGRGAPEDPVKMDRIQKVSYAYNVDRWLTFPITWYRDLEHPKYGKPETYIVHRLSPIVSTPSTVHDDRVIRFDGNPLPPLASVRNWGWGASVIDAVYDALRNWGMSNQAAASVIPNFITYAMKIGNLQQLVANGDWATIQARVSEVFAQMSIQNMMAYGDDESIEKMGTPVAGLPELLSKFQDIVSGAVDIPKSILFQAESGALGGNAAGSDRDNYFDSISSSQETELRPKVRYWLDVIGIPLGLKPGEVEFEFNSLKKMSPTEEADLYVKNAQADQIYINTQVVHPEQVAIHRFGGQKYNPAPLVFDTSREEKIVENIKNMPIELGSQDQFSISFTGDPEGGEEEEGGGLPGSEEGNQEDSFGEWPTEEEHLMPILEDVVESVQEVKDNQDSALLEQDLEHVEKPKKKKKYDLKDVKITIDGVEVDPDGYTEDPAFLDFMFEDSLNRLLEERENKKKVKGSEDMPAAKPMEHEEEPPKEKKDGLMATIRSIVDSMFKDKEEEILVVQKNQIRLV